MLGTADGLLVGRIGLESTVSNCSLLEAKEAFLALSSRSLDGRGAIFRGTFARRLPALGLREGRGGATACLELLEILVAVLVILDADGVLMTGCGLSVVDFVLDMVSILGGNGGNSTSPHAGALILFSSDLVLVVVNLGPLYSFEGRDIVFSSCSRGVFVLFLVGSGGGCFRDGRGGGPLGVLPMLG